MLSSTYSVSDVKFRLVQSYDDFGYDTEIAYTDAVLIALEDSQFLHIYPALGATQYATVKAKDKVSLTERETYIYMAEVYYACSELIIQQSVITGSTSSASDSEKLTVEGYIYETTGASSSGVSLVEDAIKGYNDKAIHYLVLAGFNPYDLQRGGAVFGASTTIQYLDGQDS